MSRWVRLWEDMPNDPKWRVVARRAGRPVGEVLAVFIHMMTNAGSTEHRGRLEGWSDEDVAIALDFEPVNVTAIREAMQGKTLEGDHLTGWEKRQPAREDGSADRSRKWRDAQRTHTNAEERDDRLNERDQPQPNAPEKSREDKIESSLREDRVREPEKPKEARKYPFPPDAFTRWYANYPEKVGRGAAEAAFDKVRKGDAVAFEMLVSALEAYRRTKPADRAWCNPATWLNQKRWEDQPSAASSSLLSIVQDPSAPLFPMGSVRWPESAIRSALERWRKDGAWPSNVGPPPGQAGCQIPSHIISEAA